MAPYTGIPLSPAELQYLHTSLSQNPPIRPDGRSPTQFRPLVAETDILSSTNGSARICFPDGTEAMVGVKAEVEKTWGGGQDVDGERTGQAVEDEEMRNAEILLLSQPLSYPLPLLSLTTHLALLSTRLPSLISERDEDPLFNDDWEASTHLFPRSKADGGSAQKPPITLLVMSVGEMIFFDASADELAVADAVVALSVTQPLQPTSTSATEAEILPLKLVALRTIDPPSRLTAGGVPNALNSTSTTGTASTGNTSTGGILAIREKDQGQSVWRPPRGGVKRAVVGRMIKAVVEKGGVGMEVMAGLAGVET
ncbi:Exosome complex component rrp42 [Friedmanniomyces endolithicus]|uniref:Ribosomal RNA-processing protein 42 n=1 Tax=Friedmanniomyces endolithicus TaxID=329885 RepID=A0AAN6J3B0_9PEZI|nr:Exosome complex component rrp42 [Friedmanniomyces endolithicus]